MSIDKILEQALELHSMDKLMRQEEDDCLDEWLTFGIPDGSTAEDLLELSQNNYDELEKLFNKLAMARIKERK